MIKSFLIKFTTMNSKTTSTLLIVISCLILILSLGCNRQHENKESKYPTVRIQNSVNDSTQSVSNKWITDTLFTQANIVLRNSTIVNTTRFEILKIYKKSNSARIIDGRCTDMLVCSNGDTLKTFIGFNKSSEFQ